MPAPRRDPFCAAAPHRAECADRDAHPFGSPAMNVEIVTIGNEVLSGRTLDTNFAFLARLLEEASVPVVWHSTVGDTQERIAEGLKRALARADAVIMTGGLGPTPDDVTRKAVATVLGRPLQLDEARARLDPRARSPARPQAAGHRRDDGAASRVARRSGPTPVGAAPGLLMVQREKPVILLPGVPAEMEALARDHVVPYLRERSGRSIESFTLRTFGAFESQLHEKIGAIPTPGRALRWPTCRASSAWTCASRSRAPTRPRCTRPACARTTSCSRRCAASSTPRARTAMEEVLGAILVEKALAHRHGRVVHGRPARQAADRRAGLVALRRARLRHLLQRGQAASCSAWTRRRSRRRAR